MYRGLRTSGFGIVDKKTSYMPFRISLNLEKIRVPREFEESRNVDDDDGATASATIQSDDSEYFLLAYAVPISTAYKGNLTNTYIFPKNWLINLYYYYSTGREEFNSPFWLAT
jgi:hypothetical protein